MAAGAFQGYVQRTSARRGAEVFAQDLRVARNAALSTQMTEVMRVDADGLGYVVRNLVGDTLVRRRFDGGSDILLSALRLDLPGDSVTFDARGWADLARASESVGRVTVLAGTTSRTVSFNAAGVSRIESP